MSNSKLNDPSATIAHAVREQLLMLDADLRVRAASRSFYTAFKVGADETLGKKLAELGNGQWNIPVLLRFLMSFRRWTASSTTLRWSMIFRRWAAGRCSSARGACRATILKVE